VGVKEKELRCPNIKEKRDCAEIDTRKREDNFSLTSIY